MIIIKSIDKGTLRGKLAVLYADTKAEVPADVNDIVIENLKSPDELTAVKEAGTVVYTAKLETAVLKSDGTWEWGD